MNRLGEFLKISNSCNEIGYVNGVEDVSCDSLRSNSFDGSFIVYQLPGGMAFYFGGVIPDCMLNYDLYSGKIDNICSEDLFVDINGPNKGKNEWGQDVYRFSLCFSTLLMELVMNSKAWCTAIHGVAKSRT